MASRKVTVTLPEQLVERVKRLAAEAGEPVSGWLARAAEQQARVEDGMAALREWEALDGALDPRERARAAAELARADAETLGSYRQTG